MQNENNQSVIREYFLKAINRYKENIIRDIGRLVAVKSVRDENTIGDGMPFGKGVRMAFDVIKTISEELSLKYEDFDGYALHIEYGDSSDVMGILTHADIVPSGDAEKWNSDPFVLTVKNGLMYGRGVNDDKAAIIGCLYIMKILKEAEFKPTKKIRLIIGGAEETTWECMDYYLKKNAPPDVAFSPDCNFPVINCEKGIIRGTLCKEMPYSEEAMHKLISLKSDKIHDYVLNELVVKIETKDFYSIDKCAKNALDLSFDGNIARIEYKVPKVLSRNPHRIANAACDFTNDFLKLSGIDVNFRNILEYLENWFPVEPFGENAGIYTHHEETGFLTLALCFLNYKSNHLSFGFDIRYPVGIEESEILNSLSSAANRDGFSLQVTQSRKRLYIKPDSNIVTLLLDAYEAVMGNRPAPLTKGGASYSRAIPNCVGFGPTFDNEVPNSHAENECMSIESLFKALNIYFEAILRL